MKATDMKIPLVQQGYIGKEPQWVKPVDDAIRQSIIISSFNWYNSSFTYKDVKPLVISYLESRGKTKDAIKFKKVKDGTIPNSIGWLSRMAVNGFPINEKETTRIDLEISKALTTISESVEVEEKVVDKKPSIQDRMEEKANDTAGVLEGLLDDYIDLGMPTKHTIKPINSLKLVNLLVHHVSGIITHWETVKDEFQLAYSGDEEALENYDIFTKKQLGNLVKFANLMIADLNNYKAYKQLNKAPRKKKVVSPEAQVRKLKFLDEYKELKLKSINPTKILKAKELFVYSTKKRKLQYYTTDDDIGGVLIVKNNSIIGFDPTRSIMKTIRKPKEQLSEFMKASRPNTRKFFKNIKAVETKLSGRFADDILILKAF